ncbi:MAG: putative Ig domain-containing protein, partial [Verrucomicrobiota bacterium]
MKRTLLTLSITLLFASATMATVTYEPTWDGNLADSEGEAIADGTLVLVLDLDGDGNDGVPYASDNLSGDTWQWDADDYILDRTKVGNPLPGWSFPSDILDIYSVDDYTAGEDVWYAIWFDTPFDEDADAPGSGVAYGVEEMGVAGNDGWTLTPSGEGGTAEFTTAGNGGGENNAPVLDAIADQSVDEEQKLTFTINATDTEEDDLTLSVTGLPEGDYFSTDPQTSPASWTFSWTPAEDESGVYDSVEFTVSDGSLSDSESTTITVNEVNTAPVLDAIGDKTVTEGETLTFDVEATDADVPANTLAFSAANVPDGADF